MGVSVGVTGGLGSISGDGGGIGERVFVGSGVTYFVGSGVGPGPSANTAVAPSKNKIPMLRHTAALWVEYGFMGVLQSFLAAFWPKFCL